MAQKSFLDQLKETDAQDSALKQSTTTPSIDQPSRGFWGGLADAPQDVGTALAKGTVSLVDSGLGVADAISGGQIGKDFNTNVINTKQYTESLHNQYSDGTRKALENVDQAHGWGKVGAYLSNPSALLASSTESVPSIAAGGAIGRAVSAIAPIAAPIAGSIGEGVLQGAQGLESVRQQTKDGLVTPGQIGLQALNAAGTTAFGALGSKLANKFGVVDMESQIQKALNGTTDASKKIGLKDAAKGVIGGAAIEAIPEEAMQSGLDQLTQNISLGKPATEGMADAMIGGGMVGAFMGGGTNALHAASHMSGSSAKDWQKAKDEKAFEVLKAKAEPLLQGQAQPTQQTDNQGASTGSATGYQEQNAKYENDLEVLRARAESLRQAQPAQQTDQQGVVNSAAPVEPTQSAADAKLSMQEAVVAQKASQGLTPTQVEVGGHVLDEHAPQGSFAERALATEANDIAYNQDSRPDAHPDPVIAKKNELAGKPYSQEHIDNGMVSSSTQAERDVNNKAYKDAIKNGDAQTAHDLSQHVNVGVASPVQIYQTALESGNATVVAAYAPKVSPEVKASSLSKAVSSGSLATVKAASEGVPAAFLSKAMTQAAIQGKTGILNHLASLDHHGKAIDAAIMEANNKHGVEAAKAIEDAARNAGKPILSEVRAADEAKATHEANVNQSSKTLETLNKGVETASSAVQKAADAVAKSSSAMEASKQSLADSQQSSEANITSLRSDLAAKKQAYDDAVKAHDDAKTSKNKVAIAATKSAIPSVKVHKSAEAKLNKAIKERNATQSVDPTIEATKQKDIQSKHDALVAAHEKAKADHANALAARDRHAVTHDALTRRMSTSESKPVSNAQTEDLKERMRLAINSVLSGFGDKFIALSNVRFVMNQDVPKDVRASNAKAYVDTNGDIVFIADKISSDISQRALFGIVLHEAGIHAGIADGNPNKLNDLIDNLQTLLASGDKRAQAAWDRIPENTHPSVVLEEFLAYFAEQNPTSTIAMQFFHYLKVAARSLAVMMNAHKDNTIVKWANTVSHVELLNAFHDGLRTYINSGTVSNSAQARLHGESNRDDNNRINGKPNGALTIEEAAKSDNVPYRSLATFTKPSAFIMQSLHNIQYSLFQGGKPPLTEIMKALNATRGGMGSVKGALKPGAGILNMVLPVSGGERSILSLCLEGKDLPSIKYIIENHPSAFTIDIANNISYDGIFTFPFESPFYVSGADPFRKVQLGKDITDFINNYKSQTNGALQAAIQYNILQAAVPQAKSSGSGSSRLSTADEPLTSEERALLSITRSIGSGQILDIMKYRGLNNENVSPDKVIKKAIEYGADINKKDSMGTTPLFFVESLDQAKAFVENGASVNVKTSHGLTPLHLAETPDIAQYLLDSGANRNAKNDEGDRPGDSIIRNVNKDRLDGVKVDPKYEAMANFWEKHDAETERASLEASTAQASDAPQAERPKSRRLSTTTPDALLPVKQRTVQLLKKISEFLRTLQIAFQNKHAEMYKRVEMARAQNGGKLSDSSDFIYAIEASHGRTAESNAKLAMAQREAKIFMNKNKISDARAYDIMLALYVHHNDANTTFGKLNKDPAKQHIAATGMTDSDAAKIVSSLTPEEKQAAQMMRKMIDDHLSLAHDAWLISRDQYQAIKKQDHYFPLERERRSMGTGQGVSVTGRVALDAAPLKAKPEKNALGLIAQESSKIIGLAEKNRIDMVLGQFIVNHFNNDKNDSKWEAYIDFPKEDTQIDPATGFFIDGSTEWVESGYMGDQTTDENGKKIDDPNYKGRDNMIIFKVEGQNRAIVFNDKNPSMKSIYTNLKNMNDVQIGQFTTLIGKVTRFLSAMNTQYNPAFGPFNFIRDAFFTMISSQKGILKGKGTEVLKEAASNMGMIYKAEYSRIHHGKNLTGKGFDELQAAREKGIFVGYSENTGSLEEHMDNLNKAVKANDGAAKNTWGMVKNSVESYNAMFENSIRFAAYKTAIKAGASEGEAVSAAKNITVNFNQKGTHSSFLGSLYSFFNSNIQGTARVFQVITERSPDGSIKLSKLGIKILGGSFMLGSMQALMLSMAGFGPDEPDEETLSKNLCIPNPFGDGEKDYVKIPYPLGFHTFISIGRIATQSAIYGDGTDRIKDVFSLAIDSYNPVGGGKSLLQAITPSIADPIAALSENRDNFGRKIYRENRDELNPIPGYTNHKSGATNISVAAAKAINDMTGGDSGKPGSLSPTPDQLDYLGGQLGAGPYRFIKSLYTTVLGDSEGNYKATSIPVAGRLIGNEDDPNKHYNRFAENMKHLNGLEASIKTARADGRNPQDVIQENPEARLIALSNKLQTEIKVLEHQKRNLREQGADNSKIQAISEKINEIHKSFNEKYTASKN